MLRYDSYSGDAGWDREELEYLVVSHLLFAFQRR